MPPKGCKKKPSTALEPSDSDTKPIADIAVSDGGKRKRVNTRVKAKKRDNAEPKAAPIRAPKQQPCRRSTTAAATASKGKRSAAECMAELFPSHVLPTHTFTNGSWKPTPYHQFCEANAVDNAVKAQQSSSDVDTVTEAVGTAGMAQPHGSDVDAVLEAVGTAEMAQQHSSDVDTVTEAVGTAEMAQQHGSDVDVDAADMAQHHRSDVDTVAEAVDTAVNQSPLDEGSDADTHEAVSEVAPGRLLELQASLQGVKRRCADLEAELAAEPEPQPKAKQIVTPTNRYTYHYFKPRLMTDTH